MPASLFPKLIFGLLLASHLAAEPYPDATTLSPSPGNLTYHVDPVRGDDSKDGTSPATAWKSFFRVNSIRLSAGDKVLVAPGIHSNSLKPTVEATAENPAKMPFIAMVISVPMAFITMLGRPTT